MDIPASQESLTQERVERIEELEALGLEVNVIAPEIFGDGVIEIKGVMDLNQEDQFEGFLWHSEYAETFEIFWSMFDAVVIRDHRLKCFFQGGTRPFEEELKGYAQMPHPDGISWKEGDTEIMDGIMLKFRPPAGSPDDIARKTQTFIMPGTSAYECLQSTRDEVSDFVKCVIDNYEIHTLDDYPRFSSIFSQHYSNVNQFSKEQVSSVPHWLMEYGHSDLLIINQRGPLRLHHGFFNYQEDAATLRRNMFSVRAMYPKLMSLDE